MFNRTTKKSGRPIRQ